MTTAIPKSGGAFTGPVYGFRETPTDDLELATKGYVDSVGGGEGGGVTDASYVTLGTNGDLSDERVLTGTSNQIVVTDNGAGSTVVLSTPQNLHTAATPTFAKLTLTGPIVHDTETITASTDTLDVTNDKVLCDCTSNAITINLPAVSGNTGLEYTITKIDSTANAVTVDANSSETIDGETTQTIDVQYDSMTIVASSAGWFII